MTSSIDGHRRTRQGLAALIVAALLALLTTFLAAPAGAKASPSSPTPTPHVTTASKKPPLLSLSLGTGNLTSLPISLDLLGINLAINVPLDLNAVLSLGKKTSTPPPTHSHTPPPSTSHPPPVQSSTPPAAHTKTAQHRTTAPSGPQLAVAGTVTSRTNPPSRSHPPARAQGGTKTRTPRTVLQQASALLSNLLPTTLARSLYLITLLVAVALAVGVMRLGRRGTH